MATVDKKLAMEAIAKNGVLHPDDPFEPAIVKIVQYTNAWGSEAYGVTFANERDQHRYDYETEYIHNPRVIFKRGDAAS